MDSGTNKEIKDIDGYDFLRWKNFKSEYKILTNNRINWSLKIDISFGIGIYELQRVQIKPIR